jgi:hypothetical protein
MEEQFREPVSGILAGFAVVHVKTVKSKRRLCRFRYCRRRSLSDATLGAINERGSRFAERNVYSRRALRDAMLGAVNERGSRFAERTSTDYVFRAGGR